MTSAQGKLALSLLALATAVGGWLYSYTLFPGAGLIRTALLFGLAWLLLARYDHLFRTVAHDNPLNQTIVGGIFAAWLFALLAVLLIALWAGYRIPTGRGINRPLGVIVLTLPLLGIIGWRFRQMYVELGRARA